jgi:protein arginine N-methyltransferase 1
MESFKRRYLARFGGPLPVFLPEAVIMAVQPIQQDYDFEGFYAPIVQFQETTAHYPGTLELAPAAVYSILDFSQPTDLAIAWQGQFVAEHGGSVNAMRFVTKNVLAVVPEQNSTIDWLNHYMALPLQKPVQVKAGDVIQVSFQYRAGAAIPSLEAAIKVDLVAQAATVNDPRIAAYA